MREKEIETLWKYVTSLHEHLKSKNRCDWFAQNSYFKWGSRECLRYVMSRPNRSAAKSVEEFANKMDEYTYMSDGEVSLIFSAAHDAAIDMLDALIFEKEKKYEYEYENIIDNGKKRTKNRNKA